MSQNRPETQQEQPACTLSRDIAINKHTPDVPGSSLRIVHVITSLDTGGAEMMLAKLLSAMNPGRFQSRVVCLLPPGPVAERIEKLNIPVKCLGMRRSYPSPRALSRLVSILRHEKPDIVQTWLYHADLMGLVASKLAGSPPVIWNIRCSDMDFSKYGISTTVTFKLLTRLSAYPQAILSNSITAARKHEIEGYKQRIRFIPNGFDTNLFRPNPKARAEVRAEIGCADGTPLVGMVTRMDPMKDHPTFFQAAARIRKTVPATQFLLCGQGLESSNDEVTRLINADGLSKVTHLLGKRDDISRIMAALDVLVLSSAYGEGFPNVLGEAMSCGIPCVSTDVGDARHIIGDTGKIVPPRRPEDLTKAIAEIFLMPKSERSLLGQRARIRIMDQFSLDSVADRYSQLYYEKVAQRRKVSSLSTGSCLPSSREPQR